MDLVGEVQTMQNSGQKQQSKNFEPVRRKSSRNIHRTPASYKELLSVSDDDDDDDSYVQKCSNKKQNRRKPAQKLANRVKKSMGHVMKEREQKICINKVKSDDDHKDEDNSHGGKEKTGESNKQDGKVGKIYQCTVCGKILSRSDTLTVHMRVHTGQRPFQCKICGTAYKVSGHLSSHMRTHSGEKPFTCNKCKKAFTYSCAMNRHRKTCGVDPNQHRMYQCEVCLRCLATEQSLKRHKTKCGVKQEDLLEHHRLKKMYECDDCGKVYSHPFALKRHKKSSCSKTFEPRHEEGKVYTCNICAKTFFNAYNLRRHMRFHASEMPLKCSVCDAGFLDTKKLSMHVISVHCRVKPFKCVECENSFATASSLSRHIRRVHRKEKHFKCCVCGKSFFDSPGWLKHMHLHTNPVAGVASENAALGKRPPRQYICMLCNKSFIFVRLRVHVEEAHPGHTVDQVVKDNLAVCSVCGKGFSKPEVLQVHMYRHSGTKPFKCDQCDSSFYTRGALALHTRNHTGIKPHTCHICHQTFRWPAGLKVHMYTHTGPKVSSTGERITYPCEVCGKMFICKEYVRNHVRKFHMPKKPANCPTCGKHFISSVTLKSHMIYHDEGGKKRYLCDVCGAGYPYQFLLRTHKKRKHSNMLNLPKEQWLCDECGKYLSTKECLQKHILSHARYPDRKIRRGWAAINLAKRKKVRTNFQKENRSENGQIEPYNQNNERLYSMPFINLA